MTLENKDLNDFVRLHLSPQQAQNFKGINDINLFHQAFMPRWINKDACYERLEFLGDSVLNIIISSYLYRRYPLESEGFMTKMRSTLVSGELLSKLTSSHTPFYSYLLFVSTRNINNHKTPHRLEILKNLEKNLNKKILEDVFEAFLGALFLDVGYTITEDWLVQFYEKHIDFADIVMSKNNSKDLLNNMCMKRYGFLPTFELCLQNTLNNEISIRIRDNNGVILSTGSGANKKEAELKAASLALRNF